MDAGIIIAVVTGGFGLSSLIIQRLFDIKCTKNENEDGSVKNVHCVPRCRNCIYPIPKQKIKDVFSHYREPPHKWVFRDTSKYTKQIPNTDTYLVILPKKLENDDGNTIWQGNVIWFKEFTKKSDSKVWFLEADLDYIKNTKSVKLFIKRFYVENKKNEDNDPEDPQQDELEQGQDNNKKWHLLKDNCEFISAHNGRNSFEADSHIGDILTEKEIKYDTEGNAVKEKKTYICTHEQIGLVIYSKTDNDIITPNIGYFHDTKKEDALNKEIETLASKCNFFDDIIRKISSRNTSICKINSVYVGDVSLYVFDNSNMLS